MDHRYDEVFVTVHSESINTNNIRRFLPYRALELDGKEHILPVEVEEGVPQCDFCFRKFPTWKDLYTHKAHWCFEDKTLNEPHPIHLHFQRHQLQFIDDVLKSLNKEVKEAPDGSLFVEHEAAFLTILLRQLYTSQVTKYNIERWYPRLEGKGLRLFALHCFVLQFSSSSSRCLFLLFAGDEGLTAKTIFLALSDDELKIIQAWSSINLSRNLGAERRPLNRELEGREKLEVCVQFLFLLFFLNHQICGTGQNLCHDGERKEILLQTFNSQPQRRSFGFRRGKEIGHYFSIEKENRETLREGRPGSFRIDYQEPAGFQ
jgi:hypothetical protein